MPKKSRAISQWRRKEDASEAAKFIAKNSGMLDELYADKSIEGLSRYENLTELLNGVKEFVDNPEREDKSLGAFLQEISLLTDSDVKDAQQEGEAVTMMTIHSAKGLEFRNVYIVGMEENLFPNQMMIASRADLEEERRLFYVAITRAEKKLTLSYATSPLPVGQPAPLREKPFPGRDRPAVPQRQVRAQRARHRRVAVPARVRAPLQPDCHAARAS